MKDVLDTVALEMLKQAEGAYGSRYVVNDRGGGSKWPLGLSSSGSSRHIDHYRSRQNARIAMQDSPLARAMVERNADTIIDTGLQLELTPDFDILGITREEAEVWSRNVAGRFHLWASDKRQHRSETMTFYQFQRIYQFSQQRDGDVFVRFYYDSNPKLQNPLQYELLDADQIRGDAQTSTYGLQNSKDGIIRDSRGREIAYKVWLKDSEGRFKDTEVSAIGPGKRVQMLHGFRPEYAGQGRGFSRLAHAVQEFENITDFSAATIKKAINQSQIVGFVKPSKDEDTTNPFEGVLTDHGAGPAAAMFGTTVEDGGSTVDPDLHPGMSACYQVPEATMDIPGSMFIANLTKGSEIELLKNTAPGDSYDKFVDAFAGYISASTGTPLEVVLMKFGSNFSASRATLLLFWRIAVGWRFEQDADMLSPTVEMWLAGEIGAGRITAPGWSDPRLRAAWLSKVWIGTPPPDIDPAKTTKARRDNIEIGVTNPEREAKNLNGSSAAANIETNRKLFENFPVAPWGQNAVVADKEQ